MLFTWDTTDLCIVFKGWHINGTGTLIVSLLLIVLLAAGYEYVREFTKNYDDSTKSQTRTSGDDLSSKRPSSLSPVRGGVQDEDRFPLSQR